MLKINTVHIKRYRSIMDLKLELSTDNNFVTICGENNTGKTNTLRAIDLFFNPAKYKPKIDAPNHKLHGSYGGSVYPEISIDIVDDDRKSYRISKRFDLNGVKSIKGRRLRWRKANKTLTTEEIDQLLKQITFFFLPSINVSFPDLITSLIDDLYDIEFEKTRFRGLKRELKTSFDQYTEGLLGTLNALAAEVNPIFREFKEDWGIAFGMKHDVEKFRDLITDDIEFYINDRSNKNIEGKGSGLQRLAYLLIHSRIIAKIKKSKSVLLLIDEPDIYLHEGLARKLYEHLLDIAKKHQVIITSHSPVFIDTYTLSNVFLLDLNISDVSYQRTGTTINLLETVLVDINNVDGAKKIRQYLGVSLPEGLLDNYNIIVEGDCDKKYLEELLKFFSLPIPNIISADGADNVKNLLRLYNGIYKERDTKPNILTIFDNDNAGREAYKKCNAISFDAIDVWFEFAPNFLGDIPDKANLNGIKTNHEIEDYLYPELVCYLCNSILTKANLNEIDIAKVCTKITRPAWKDKGILAVLENEKNETNPEKGNLIEVEAIAFKKGMVNQFVVEGNMEIIKLLKNGNDKFPHIKNFLTSISSLVETRKLEETRDSGN